MSAPSVRLVKLDPHPTAVVAQTTTWAEFPSLWGALLGDVNGFVRTRSDLATGRGGEMWQNVMLYKDQRPDVEIGVLVSTRFEPEGRVISSELPGGEVATATHLGDYSRLGVTHDAVREYVTSLGRQWQLTRQTASHQNRVTGSVPGVTIPNSERVVALPAPDRGGGPAPATELPTRAP